MLEVFLTFIDIVLHVDVYLHDIVSQYGTYVYMVLFIIVFCETGLVVTPFLPGDSLLFAGGTLVGLGMMDYWPLVGTLLSAAVLGDAVNYSIGKHIGPPVFERNYRFLKKEHLLKAQGFYERHGGKAIILARFIPIVRTFAPFVAGVASMCARRFLFFNITGALLWVFLLVTAGYKFSDSEVVKNNFSLVIIAIIVISVLPVAIEIVKARLSQRR